MQPAVSSSPPFPRWPVAAALVVGPVLLLAGMILMSMPDVWTVSHLVFLAGTLAMLPAGVALHGLIRARSPSWLG